MRASILIASFNEGDALRKTVASCAAAREGLDCEIIVSDNGSADGSLEAAQRECSDLRLLVDHSAKGPSPTKHRAAQAARGHTLVFLDGHCRIDRQSLHRLVADVEEWRGEAAIVPRVFSLDVATWQWTTDGLGVCQRLNLENLEQPTFARQGLFRPQGRFTESAGLIGCSFAIGGELYMRLRGCDPDMRVWGSDDADLGLKAWLMGYPVLADSEVQVGHRFRVGAGTADLLPDVLANRLRMARKNFTEPIWSNWLERFRLRYDEATATAALAVFESRRASVEEERDYLMTHRRFDEFWFAEHFGLRWPRALRVAGLS